jgi:hypothetical protein
MLKHFSVKYNLLCLGIFLLLNIVSPTNIIARSELGKEIDIIPSPKVMKVAEKKFILSHESTPQARIIINNDDPKAAIAAEAINERVKILGGISLPIETNYGKAGGRTDINSLVLLSLARQHEAVEIPRDAIKSREVLKSKGEQGYLIRFYQDPEGDSVAILTGIGWPGLLHASNTFRLLIQKEGSTIYATEAQITDWPDFNIRGLPVWPLPGSYAEFKRYVDWASQYKFNRIYTYSTRKHVADGFNLPSSEERRYLKSINNYARDRGIIINYALNWAVGTEAHRGNKEDYRGAVLFNGHYYTWGNDRLLRKRATDIAEFAKEIDAGSLHLHCIDTYEESWDSRGTKDRERFRNDRAAADANVINIFTEEIRKLNPGIELQFVVYPYHVNFNLKGNEQYKTWIKKVSEAIPNDVYLVVTEFNRDQTDSWISNVKQPLVHWVNGNAFQWGRYFSTYPAFTKSSYYSGRDRDIIINFEPIGYFNGEVMQLFASEYAWNTEATGSGYIREDIAGAINVTGGNLHYRAETIDEMAVNSWSWYFGTSEPKEATKHFFLKACRLEYGDVAAPYMADFFINNPIGWRSATLYGQVLNDVMAGHELDASCDQLKKVEKALSNLKGAIDTVKMDKPERDRLKYFLKSTYRQYLVIVGTTAYYQAKHLFANGLSTEAADVIKDSARKLTEIRREMEIKGYWSDDSQNWLNEGISRLIIAEIGLRKHHSSNLIGNPGFEEHFNTVGHDQKIIPKWSATAGSLTLSKDSHSGKYAGKLTLKPNDKFILLEQQFTISAKCKYYLEFWMKKKGSFRVIPLFQYNDIKHSKKEFPALTDFPHTADVHEFTLYSGVYTFPSHIRQAVFKLYADWFGFAPANEKYFFVDDVFISCLPIN